MYSASRMSTYNKRVDDMNEQLSEKLSALNVRTTCNRCGYEVQRSALLILPVLGGADDADEYQEANEAANRYQYPDEHSHTAVGVVIVVGVAVIATCVFR